jgi:hypothetical protein
MSLEKVKTVRFPFGFRLAFVVSLSLSLGFAVKAGKASSAEYVTGKVTSGQSSPVSSVWVMVYDGPQIAGQTLTGDDGRYYIGGLNSKTYTAVVRRQQSGGNLVSSTITLPQNRVYNIRLP